MLGRLKELLTAFFNPIAFFLVRLGVTPNVVTVLGLLLSVFSALFIVGGRLDPLFRVDEANRLIIASILLLSSGLCDLLDGLVARMGSMVTVFGGFFDSILDRYSETVFLVTLIYMNYCSVLWGLLALSGSLLVSYARARGEVAGLSGVGVGLAERPERLLLLSGAVLLQGFLLHNSFASYYVIEVAVIVVALLSHFTVLQRGYYAWTHLQKIQ